MDTIIYFIKKKGLREPFIEPIGLKTYMLVRVSLDVGAEEWFGRTLRIPGQPEKRDESAKVQDARERRHFLGILRRRSRQEKRNRLTKKERHLEEKRRKAESLEYERLLAEREERLRQTEEALRRLKRNVMELAGEERDCCCVYEDTVRKALVGSKIQGQERISAENSAEAFMAEYTGNGKREKGLSVLWRQYFDLREFEGYCRPFWVEQLMSEAVWPHFVILGTVPEVFSMLEHYACKMKSLRWILLESDYTEELLADVEDFYTEYGLAIELQYLEGTSAWKKFRLSCVRPSNILDFTGEARLAVPEIPEGSVWLDMLSVEEKRRRMMGRNNEISYTSLKEKWKYAQRRCSGPVLP